MRKTTSVFLSLAVALLLGLNLVSFVAGLGIGWYGRGTRDSSFPARTSPLPCPTLATESASVTGSAQLAAEPTSGLDIFLQAWELVNQDFFADEPIDNTAANYAAIRGFLGSLNDPHTRFVEPPEAELDKSSYEGKFGGIGAYISSNEDGQPMISSVIPGNPAEEAGVMAGDVILTVDGQLVQGLSQDEVVLLIRGPVDTVVSLVVRRVGFADALEMAIRRAEIKLPTVSWQAVDEGRIAHIRLTFFASPTSQELAQALDEIDAVGISEIILDLRGNRGGLLSAAGDVAGQFIHEGVLLYERRRENDSNDIIEEAYMIPSSRQTEDDSKLVVLIDGGTASASEIVAGAIQDYGRGTLIGETTFGKGSMQYVHELGDGSSLHVTAAHWLTPNRHPINGVGLVPDIEVPLTQEDIGAGLDPQLDRAIADLAEARKAD